MPAVLCKASFRVSRLRSSISRSVTTVTDCGMSRSSCVPLPIWVVTACTLSLPVRTALARALTTGICWVASAGDGVAGGVCGGCWAWARPIRPKPAARAPSKGVLDSSEDMGAPEG